MKLSLLFVTTFLCSSTAMLSTAQARGITLWSEGESSVKLKGRVQFDAVTFDDDNRDYKGNQDVRRARLTLFGNITDEWSYKFENAMETKFWFPQSAFLAYQPNETNWRFVFGQHKVPSGFESINSSLDVPFTERSSVVSAFNGGRRGGVSARYNTGGWTAQLGVYDEQWAQTSSNDEGWQMAGRTTLTPYKDGNNLLHLGVSLTREFDDEDNSFRFRERPATRLTNSLRAVDTGSLSEATHTDTLGLEAAFQYKNLILQGEYMQVAVDRDNGFADVDLDGWYVGTSYMLTGEQRKYKSSSASFAGFILDPDTMVDRGGFGAWQLAARFSNLDLNDGVVAGGEMDTVTMGVNWYPLEQVRVTLNQVFIDTDANAVVPNDNPKVTALRLQYTF